MDYSSIWERQLTLQEIFKMATSIFMENFMSVLVVVLIIFVPINVVEAIIPIEAIIKNEDLERMFYYSLLSVGMHLFFAPLCTMAVAAMTNATAQRKKLGFQQAMEDSFHKWFTLIITNVFYIPIIVVGSIFLLIPGMYFSILYSFFVYAIALSGKKGFDALAHAASLVKGKWFKVFGVNILIFIFSLSLSYLLQPFVGTGDMATVIGFCFNMISAMLGAFFYVLFSVWFINLEGMQQTEAV